jgi:hypothetical protein
MHLAFVALFSALLITGVIVFPRRRWSVLLFGLPWLPVILFGTFPVFICGTLIFFVFIRDKENIEYLLKEYLNGSKLILSKPVFRQVLLRFFFCLFSVSAVLIVSDYQDATRSSIVYSALLNLAVMLLLVGLTLVKYSKQEHRLYYHIPLGIRKKVRLQKSKIVSFLIVLGVIYSAPFILQRVETPIDTYIPVMRDGIDTERFTLQDLNAIGLADQDGIPGIADYVAHRFYQEAYLFNPPYRIPPSGEQVLFSRYSEGEDSMIAVTQDSALTATDEWLWNVLDEVSDTGILRLLLDQSRIGEVKYENILQIPSKKIEIIIYFLAWFLIHIPGLLSITYLTPLRLYGMKPVELRRRCQTA